MRFISLSLALLFPLTAFGAPFLVSDPDPTAQADTCSYINGAGTQVDTPTVAYSCKVDLAGFTAGTHNLQVSFKNLQWGTESAKVPFVFVRPVNGSIGPANMTITK